MLSRAVWWLAMSLLHSLFHQPLSFSLLIRGSLSCRAPSWAWSLSNRGHVKSRGKGENEGGRLRTWMHTAAMPVFVRLRQEDPEFQASLCYTVNYRPAWVGHLNPPRKQ